MNNVLRPISLAQAKAIAEQHAFVNLESFGVTHSQLLKAESLEAECCWMFFRNEHIDVPPEAMLGIKWAYVVSKKGTYGMVQDFSDNHEKLLAYLQTMSDYFKRRGE
ncbi:hypothetical protein [Paraherbaspirillum soli]|uniref:Uncharacterized protein n=1 Tax=Paraherbaspirillum soli TaxID=631222 RepID=A0ABW0MG05_9BURK